MGIKGTAQVAEIKTTLRGIRKKNTLAMKNLSRQIGMFKECVNGDEEQKPSGFLNSKLKNVLDAQKIVESTFDVVSLNMAELTYIMCEMQNDRQLSEAQVKELKEEVREQEKKFTKEGMNWRK